MDEKPVKSEIKSLNNFLYDNDLSIDELEERLELAAPWICIGYVCGDCPDFTCNPVVPS